MILESKIQAANIKRLEKDGYYVVKIITCNKNGFPDIMALKDGKASFIEFKKTGKKLRPLQEFRANELKRQGFEVKLIDSI